MAIRYHFIYLDIDINYIYLLRIEFHYTPISMFENQIIELLFRLRSCCRRPVECCCQVKWYSGVYVLIQLVGDFRLYKLLCMPFDGAMLREAETSFP
jgi:hypothetical protein